MDGVRRKLRAFLRITEGGRGVRERGEPTVFDSFMPLCWYDSLSRSLSALRVWRRGADAPAGRSAGGARSLLQHLVDGRSPQWRRHETLDGQAEYAYRLRADRWQELSHHGARAAGGQRTGADAAGSAAHAHHL